MMSSETVIREPDAHEFCKCSTCGVYGSKDCCPPLIVLAFQASGTLNAGNFADVGAAKSIEVNQCERLELLGSARYGGLTQ